MIHHLMMCNGHLTIFDKYGPQSKQAKVFAKQIRIEVDHAKTGIGAKRIRIPFKVPDYVRSFKPKYKSNHVLGKIYRKVKKCMKKKHQEIVYSLNETIAEFILQISNHAKVLRQYKKFFREAEVQFKQYQQELLQNMKLCKVNNEYQLLCQKATVSYEKDSKFRSINEMLEREIVSKWYKSWISKFAENLEDEELQLKAAAYYAVVMEQDENEVGTSFGLLGAPYLSQIHEENDEL